MSFLSYHKAPTRAIGQHYEDLALSYLQSQGLKLIARNFTAYRGELDLIMRDKTHLVFVEVRYRKGKQYGNSLESVSKTKQKRIISAAHFFLLRYNQLNFLPCRFDIVAINAGDPPEVQWIKDAFYATD
jgi:putative endonuclease